MKERTPQELFAGAPARFVESYLQAAKEAEARRHGAHNHAKARMGAAASKNATEKRRAKDKMAAKSRRAQRKAAK